MTNRIELFINTLQAGVSSAIGTISGFLFSKYIFENKNINDINDFTLIAIAIIVFLLTVILNYVINYFIEESKQLRKLMLGTDFIEGFWVQKINNESLSLMKTPQYSLVYIEFDKNCFKITGISFQEDCSEITANFHSKVSFYKKGILDYPFSVISLEKQFSKKKNIFGEAELRFTRSNHLSMHYIGRISSNMRNEAVLVTGKKIDVNHKVDVHTIEGRRSILNYLK